MADKSQTCKVFSSHNADVDNTISQEMRITCVLRAMKGARVSIVLATKVILVFSLVASLGKYAFIQNPYLYLLIIV